MAANVMSLVPVLIIFFLAQRYFIRSVASTGLAGTWAVIPEQNPEE